MVTDKNRVTNKNKVTDEKMIGTVSDEETVYERETVSEEEEMYKENILDHYKHPHNKREMVDCTVKANELNPLCGDEVTLYLKIENSKIVDITFTGHGCAISQAAISLLTDELKGKSLAEARNINSEKILRLLGIKVSHTRMKCALLSLKVLSGGLEQCSK